MEAKNNLNQQKPEPDYIEPAGYDLQGRPLYYHPPQQDIQAVAGQDNQVQQSPAQYAQNNPTPASAAHQMKRRHEESKRVFPELDLNEAEYVIKATRRHPIGLFYIWFAEALAMLLLLTLAIFLVTSPEAAGDLLDTNESIFSIIAFFLAVEVLLLLFGWVGTIVYRGNRFIVTNERVIQYIQTSLFAKRRQTINLSGIEDVSYRQTGVVQHIFGYGSIRLSTVGEETTYRFNIVADPSKQITYLNGAVQAFKNGRPVPDDLIDITYTKSGTINDSGIGDGDGG